MESIVPYAIWAAIIVGALAILVVVGFSIRNAIYGKAEPLTIGAMVVPVVVFVILGFVMSTWALAAIWTMIVMFVLSLLALLYTGMRGMFT